jgi:hypothetical protein
MFFGSEFIIMDETSDERLMRLQKFGFIIGLSGRSSILDQHKRPE